MLACHAAVSTLPGARHTKISARIPHRRTSHASANRLLPYTLHGASRTIHSVHALIFPICRRSVKDALRGTDVVGSHVRITVRRGESSEETVTLRRSPMSYVYLIQVQSQGHSHAQRSSTLCAQIRCACIAATPWYRGRQ